MSGIKSLTPPAIATITSINSKMAKNATAKSGEIRLSNSGNLIDIRRLADHAKLL
jgi:hypothetical protein